MIVNQTRGVILLVLANKKSKKKDDSKMRSELLLSRVLVGGARGTHRKENVSSGEKK